VQCLVYMAISTTLFMLTNCHVGVQWQCGTLILEFGFGPTSQLGQCGPPCSTLSPTHRHMGPTRQSSVPQSPPAPCSCTHARCKSPTLAHAKPVSTHGFWSEPPTPTDLSPTACPATPLGTAAACSTLPGGQKGN
jgi:hypothetical protein